MQKKWHFFIPLLYLYPSIIAKKQQKANSFRQICCYFFFLSCERTHSATDFCKSNCLFADSTVAAKGSFFVKNHQCSSGVAGFILVLGESII